MSDLYSIYIYDEVIRFELNFGSITLLFSTYTSEYGALENNLGYTTKISFKL
jgi:hypothetical protein